jgi:hypothetical protein
VLEGYDVFVIPQAHSSYTADELLAVQNFVFNGGGFLVIGDDNPWIYAELTSFAGIAWESGGTSGITTDITPHPVTTGVASVYLSAPIAIMHVTGTAQDLVRDPACNIMLAVSEHLSGKVLGFADEDSLWDYGIGQADNLLLANNMIDWLAISIRCEHDLAVTLDAPKFFELGNSTVLHATVLNNGLNNETDVELYLLINDTVVSSVTIPQLLVIESYTINYTWTPISTGSYNITAYAAPVLEEEYVTNNVVTKWACVFFYTRLHLSHEWIGSGNPMGWHADDASWQYTLPFDFPFYGVYYRTIYISSNGLITFLGPDASCGNSMPSLAQKLAIAPAWDDWITYDPYDIFIWQNSTHIGIRWYVRAYDAYGSDVVANFETILSADGVIQCNYGYDDGPISTTIGISNGAGHIIAEDATTLNYINTIIFLPFQLEHELGVSLEALPLVKVGTSMPLNATVLNLGLSNETDVELQILINGTVVQSTTISELLVGDSCTLSYLWTPTVEGIYNVTAYAPPVPDEEFTRNNIATKNVNVQPVIVHDVAVTEITLSSNIVYQGWIVGINVTVANFGNALETFDVTLYYDDTQVGSRNVVNLPPSRNVTLTFYWNTTGMSRGNYTIKGKASIVPGETDIEDNSLSDGVVEVLWHDVAIVDVIPSQAWVYQGHSVNINVTVRNEGDYPEIVTVTLYYNITANKKIGTQVINLLSGETQTIIFVWNTAGVDYCHNYTITAVASIAFPDADPTDNTSPDGKVKVRIMGDINGDGIVDMADISIQVDAFLAELGHLRWNSDADLDLDHIIDMADVAITIDHFLEECP